MPIDDIKAAFTQAAQKELPRKIVPVPSLGIELAVVGMNGRDRSLFRRYCSNHKGKDETHAAKLLSLTVCDPESGERLYPGNHGDEFMGLGPEYQNDIDNLIEAAYDLSFASEDEADELEKN